MKIVLVSSDYVMPSRGIYAIQRNLIKHGWNCLAFSYFYLTPDKIKIFCDQYLKPGDLLGLSITFSSDQDSIEVYRNLSLEAKSRGCEIIIGGINQQKNHFVYDYDLTGSYKEDALIDFLNSKYSKIKKIPYEIGHDTFVWDTQQFPNNTVLPVEVSRHCVFDCKFCTYPNRGIKGENRNYELVRFEMDSANQLYGTRAFNVVCSTFNESDIKLDNFFKAVEGSDYEFCAYMRLDLLIKQKDYWPKIKQHFKYMKFGVETFNYKSGRTIGKGSDPKKVKEWLQEIRDYFDDAFLSSGFIVGLPYSNIDEHEQDLVYLEQTKVLDSYNFIPLSLDLDDGSNDFNSYFDRNIQEYGYVKTKFEEPFGRFSRWRVKWQREDGFNSDAAVALCDDLNSRKTNIAPPDLAIVLKSLGVDLNVLKSTHMNSTPYQSVLPSQYKRYLNRQINNYWKLYGIR